MKSGNSKKTLDVVVIIVSYNSRSFLEKLFPVLLNGECRFQVIIVDNASTDNTVEWLKNHYSQVAVIENKRNKGFAAAVNQAAALADSEYLLLLNPDSLIRPDQLDGLIRILSENRHAVAVGPRIVYPDGELQPSRGRFPGFISAFAHIFNLKRFMPSDEKVMHGRVSFLGKLFFQYRKPDFLEKVDYTTGACVLIRSSAFNSAGGLDERFFLYYEEIDLALRMKRNGGAWLYTDRIEIGHAVGESSKGVPLLSFEARYKSMYSYYGKNKNRLESTAVWALIALKSLYHLIRLPFPQLRIGRDGGKMTELKVLLDLILIPFDKKKAVSIRSIPPDFQ